MMPTLPTEGLEPLSVAADTEVPEALPQFGSCPQRLPSDSNVFQISVFNICGFPYLAESKAKSQDLVGMLKTFSLVWSASQNLTPTVPGPNH